MVRGYAIPLQKTHNLSFESRQVCYPWHRWYALTIMTRGAGGAHADMAYFCKLPEAPLDVMLIEIPKWMFDAAHCATMRLVDDPRVDCETLRELKSTIARLRVSIEPAMLQPQVSRQAGDGDIDDSDSPSKSKSAAGAIRRTARSAKLERSHRIDASRCSQTAGPTARQRSDKPSSSRASGTGRAR
jgi:hypothetical protein